MTQDEVAELLTANSDGVLSLARFMYDFGWRRCEEASPDCDDCDRCDNCDMCDGCSSYEDGKSDGFDDGYSEGHDEGYDEGYSNGVQDAHDGNA